MTEYKTERKMAGLPIRPRPPAFEPMDQADLLAIYGHRVLELHQPEPRRLGEMPVCSCGSTEVLCAYRCLARSLGLLGIEASR